MKINIGNHGKWVADERRWSELMARSHRGDSDAYNILLTELGKVIFKYLLVRFGASNWLEDMVQECLLAIHKGRHTYDPARPFRPWLFALVRNRSIDFLRTQGKTARTRQACNSSPAVEDSYEPNHDIPLDLARIFAGLSPDHREALTLTKYAGYTIEEAAAWTGVSTSAMKLRVSRALAKTRNKLSREQLQP